MRTTQAIAIKLDIEESEIEYYEASNKRKKILIAAPVYNTGAYFVPNVGKAELN